MGNPVPRQRGVGHTVLIALLVCAGYYVGAELAHVFRIPSTRSSIIWVPNAVLLAALLLTPPRFWAIWFLAALPAHLAAQSRDGGLSVVLLYPFIANVAQVIVAAMGLRFFACAPPRFDTLRDMTLFVLIAAITAPALISLLAAWLFVAVGWETDFWLVSRGRFLNNVTTSLTVAPLILMVAEGWLARVRRLRVQRHVEFALIGIGLLGALYLTHVWKISGAESIPVRLYAPLPFLLWAAVRFGPGGLCLFLLVVAAQYISETISGRGPYAAQTPAENVLALQICLAVLATPLMFVAALTGERRKKEEALQESEERYRAVVEHQTELVCRFLRNGTLTFVNPAYARYFGKSPDELIGQSFLHSVPEEERQAAMEHVRSLGRNLSTGSCERRVFTAQDELRWLQWVDQPILDDDGRVIEFQSVGRDITKRKRAEESLQRSEERFRRVLETAPDGMVLVQADATIAFANEQMEKVLGYTREELIGQGMEMLALESVQGQAQHRLDGFVHARARPGGSGLELYGRRKDGSEVPLEIRLSPLETKEGVLVCAAIRDITDRKRAEEALRQSEERYRAIVEDQTEMICRWLPDATLTFVNQAYCRYFGKTRQELIGTSYVSLIPEADREAVQAHIASVIASVSEANPISTCEHSVVLASGETRWQQWTDRAIFDAQGRLVGFQSVGRDITDRMRAERRHNTQYAVAQVLAESGSLRDAVSPLLRAVCEGIGWDLGELWYVDSTPNVLRWGGLWHAPFVEVAEFEAVSRVTTFAPGRGFPGRVWASGEPTWIPDVRTEPAFIRASVAAKVGLHGALAFPIQGDREVTGVMVFFSRRVLQPDPELLWTMFDIGGRIGQFMERKRAEEALRDSEERYRTLVEYSPAAIVVHDLERGRYVDCNQSAIDLFGLDRDRLLEGGPEAVSPRLQPDGTPSEEKLRAATSKGLERDRLEYDYTFVNAAGQEIPCEVRAVRLPVKDRILLRASIVNIADRKRAEEALEKHRAFLRQVIDIDPNFIFAKDREGRFTLVNQAVADAYGTTVEDLIGKTDADFNPRGDEVEHFRHMDLEVMDTLQERFIREERLTDAEGNVRWLQTVKRPIVGEDGTANQVLASATDITRRKRAEEELRAREAALRDSQKDLQDLAGKLLKAQEEERRRLARELHDDLTQRLAVLAIEAGRLEQQLQGAPNPALERLRHMKEQIVKLSADVHGISRQLHPSILDDLGLVSAMESECANLTQRAGIAVKYESHNVPTTLPQDVALCLYRIAQEALWNIAKHAQTTEAFVSLVGTEDAITLSVWDDGVGFDPAQLHRKPGLGLASMEERVRLIRGGLSVKSEPGRGTEIEVTVPLRRD